MTAKSRKHVDMQATEYGPGVTPPKNNKFVTKYKIPFEDLAFVLNFIHPDNTVPSYKFLLVAEVNSLFCG